MLFRMKTTFIRFAMALWLAASYHAAAGQELKSADQAYQHLAEEIVASHLAWNPAAAVELGISRVRWQGDRFEPRMDGSQARAA